MVTFKSVIEVRHIAVLMASVSITESHPRGHDHFSYYYIPLQKKRPNEVSRKHTLVRV